MTSDLQFSFYDACDEKDTTSVAREITTALENSRSLSTDVCEKLYALACDRDHNNFIIDVAKAITTEIYKDEDFYASILQGATQGGNDALIANLDAFVVSDEVNDDDFYCEEDEEYGADEWANVGGPRNLII